MEEEWQSQCTATRYYIVNYSGDNTFVQTLWCIAELGVREVNFSVSKWSWCTLWRQIANSSSSRSPNSTNHLFITFLQALTILSPWSLWLVYSHPVWDNPIQQGKKLNVDFLLLIRSISIIQETTIQWVQALLSTEEKWRVYFWATKYRKLCWEYLKARQKERLLTTPGAMTEPNSDIVILFY